MAPPGETLAGPLLATETSVCVAAIVVVAVDESSAAFESAVAVVTLAVFVIVPVAPLLTFTTIENPALAPLTRVPSAG